MKTMKCFITAIALMLCSVCNAKDVKPSIKLDFRTTNQTELIINEKIQKQTFFGDPVMNMYIIMDHKTINFDVYEKYIVDGVCYLAGKSSNNPSVSLVSIKDNKMQIITNKRVMEIPKIRLSFSVQDIIDNMNESRI